MFTRRQRPADTIFYVTILILSAVSGADARGRKPPQTDQGKEKPRLNLVADPAVGFTPVTAVVTGRLTGVDTHDPNFCHAAVIWIRIDPGQSEEGAFNIREDPACLHPPEETSVETSFTRTFVLYRPGPYLLKLVVEGKDGTRVQSTYAKVQVLSAQ